MGLWRCENCGEGIAPNEANTSFRWAGDSHNFMKVKPDEMLELIPLLPVAGEVANGE